MKQLIHLRQNLQKTFKKSGLEQSEKNLNFIKKDEDESDNNNVSPIMGHVEYTPKNIQKIINLKKNLQNNYRKTVLNDKYTSEKKLNIIKKELTLKLLTIYGLLIFFVWWVVRSKGLVRTSIWQNFLLGTPRFRPCPIGG